MSEVVTGDAVVVEVRMAQMPSRAVAVVIDMLVQATLMVGFVILLSNFAIISDPALFAAVNIIMVVLVMVGYPVLWETFSRGRSPGKLALGLRVVGDDGSPERFRQALMRGLSGVMEFWMFSGAPALISSLISQRGKRLGDVFAGTIVIAERGPRDTTQAILMPPQLAGWASTLELSQLPDGVATAARQYLTRWHDLTPAVQQEMGVRIANQVAAYVAPAAPGGVPPHAYLSAVLAERRRREEVRLARHTTPPSTTHHPHPGPTPQPNYAPSATPPPSYAPPAAAQPSYRPHGPQPGYATPAPQPSYTPPTPQPGYAPSAPQPSYAPQAGAGSPVPQPAATQPGQPPSTPWAQPWGGQRPPAPQPNHAPPGQGQPGPAPFGPGQHGAGQHGPGQHGVPGYPAALPDYGQQPATEPEPPAATPGGFAPPA